MIDATERDWSRLYRRARLSELCEEVGFAVWELQELQHGRAGDPWTFMARALDCARAAEEAGHVFTG